MELQEKVITLEAYAGRADKLRESGKKIVFTNGCFDILHAGHVRYLAAARSEGDVLVVGLNSDLSVKMIKDPGRPIIDQAHRSEVLSGLSCVDHIIFFDEADPLALIKAVKPDVLVKGADWEVEDIVGADIVSANGGKVVRVPVVSEISTTAIIEKIVKTYGSENPE
jgi:D-glycero-beta-D-manno-heptose 1-phosphate adenylyltransferase